MASRMVTILGIMAHEVAHVAEMINDRIDVLLVYCHYEGRS